MSGVNLVNDVTSSDFTAIYVVSLTFVKLKVVNCSTMMLILQAICLNIIKKLIVRLFKPV